MTAAFQNCGNNFHAAKNVKEFSAIDLLVDYSADDLVIAGTPTVPSWYSPFPQPAVKPDCYTNPDFNLCLAMKDPVSTFGQGFQPVFAAGSALPEHEAAVFTYGAKVPVSDSLSNSHFYISVPAEKRVRPTENGDYKYSLRTDTNGYLGQLHAWYWLNRQLTLMTRRTGKFYYSRRGAPIRVGSSEARDNAFFSGVDMSITLGDTGFGMMGPGPRGDLALDATVVTHEAGHGNLFVASNGQGTSALKEICTNGVCRCVSERGCWGAIHEGMADFHALILFPSQSAAIGSYYRNSTLGLRNMDAILSYNTAPNLFMQVLPHGEIHTLGQAYGAIWYGVWKKWKAAGNERSIEVLFTEHLAGLSGQDDFLTAYNTIVAIARNIYPKSADMIAQDFATQYRALGLAQQNSIAP